MAQKKTAQNAASAGEETTQQSAKPVVQTVKSITPKLLNDNVNFTKKDINRIIGHVSGIVEEYFLAQLKHGEKTGFKGDFLALDGKGKNAYDSEALFLPQNASDQILNRLKEGENEITIEGSLKLVESDKSQQGYAIVMEKPRTQERKARKAQLREQFEKTISGLALEG